MVLGGFVMVLDGFAMVCAMVLAGFVVVLQWFWLVLPWFCSGFLGPLLHSLHQSQTTCVLLEPHFDRKLS